MILGDVVARFLQILFQNGGAASILQAQAFSEIFLINFLENASKNLPIGNPFPKCRFEPRRDVIFKSCSRTSPHTVYGFETAERRLRNVLSAYPVARPLIPFTVLKHKDSKKAIDEDNKVARPLIPFTVLKPN